MTSDGGKSVARSTARHYGTSSYYVVHTAPTQLQCCSSLQIEQQRGITDYGKGQEDS